MSRPNEESVASGMLATILILSIFILGLSGAIVHQTCGEGPISHALYLSAAGAGMLLLMWATAKEPVHKKEAPDYNKKALEIADELEDEA